MLQPCGKKAPASYIIKRVVPSGIADKAVDCNISKSFFCLMCTKNVCLLLLASLLTLVSLAQKKPDSVTAIYKLGSASLTYKTTCFGPQSAVIFVNVHENESTSVNATKQVLDSVKQYCLVELQFNKKRLINFNLNRKNYSIDPNRIYTQTGTKATLKKYNKYYTDDVLQAVTRMAQKYISSYIDNKQFIVALHNNSDGDYSVLSYSATGEYAKDAVDVYINEQQDADDFFFTTERKFFEFLKARKYNTVLQHSSTAADDGSLSIYCATKSIPYINIEAGSGNLSTQIEMIRVVLRLIAGS